MSDTPFLYPFNLPCDCLSFRMYAFVVVRSRPVESFSVFEMRYGLCPVMKNFFIFVFEMMYGLRPVVLYTYFVRVAVIIFLFLSGCGFFFCTVYPCWGKIQCVLNLT